MADLGDLLGLLPDPAPAATRRARRPRIRCRNPRCGRWVYADQAIFGYGRCCAEALGLVVRRWKLADHGQAGPDLLDTLEAPVTVPRCFLLRPAAGGAALAEGVIFTDGAVVVYRLPTSGEHSSNRHFDRYPVGSAVAGRIAAGEVPRAIVPIACVDGAEVELVWLDEPEPEPAAAPATPRRAELAEPDLTAGAYE